MNKLLSSILASTMILSTIGTSFAQETTQTPEQVQEIQTQTLSTLTWDGVMPTNYSDESLFRLDSSGSLTAYSPLSGDVVIPPSINGYPVTNIYAYAIRDWGSNNGQTIDLPPISTLVIPDSVTSLAGEAITCSATTVYLGSGLKKIGTMGIRLGKNLTGEDVTIYYNGTKEDRDNISIGSYNTSLQNATWIYVATPTYPDWAISFIDFVSGEIMPDISPENFDFASNRGLIAQSLFNFSGEESLYQGVSRFTDIGTYGSAISWCDSNDVMSGTGDSTFGTESNVQREQLCLILKQMATVLEKDTLSGDVSALEGYSDAWSISSWAQEGVAWAVANNLMQGSDNALNPHGDVTRLEVAVMLMAFSQL